MRARVLGIGLVVLGLWAPVGLGAIGTTGSWDAFQPETPTTMQRAGALFQQGKWKEAAKAYESVIEDEPEHPQAWFQLGYCYHMLGDYERAIPAHRKASALSPAGTQLHFLALYNEGCAQALLGNKDEAFDALMRSIEGGFHSQQSLQQVREDTDLDSLRKDARFARFVETMRRAARSDALQRFDFWVGDWDVYNRSGTLVGHNTIDSIEGGLVLLEHWKSVGGSTGVSTNYYEPVGRVWKQVWVDAQGVLETSGKWEDGAMRFTGKRMLRDGSVKQHRMVFTPGEKGVRQFIEESDDGQTWSVYFDGLYVQAGSDSPGDWGDDAQAASDASALLGIWDMSVDAGGSEMGIVLSFQRDGSKIAGTIEVNQEASDLEQISVSDGTLRMRATSPQGMTFDFEGTIEGNQIQGKWSSPDGQGMMDMPAKATRREL